MITKMENLMQRDAGLHNMLLNTAGDSLLWGHVQLSRGML